MEDLFARIGRGTEGGRHYLDNIFIVIRLNESFGKYLDYS